MTKKFSQHLREKEINQMNNEVFEFKWEQDESGKIHQTDGAKIIQVDDNNFLVTSEKFYTSIRESLVAAQQYAKKRLIETYMLDVLRAARADGYKFHDHGLKASPSHIPDDIEFDYEMEEMDAKLSRFFMVDQDQWEADGHDITRIPWAVYNRLKNNAWAAGFQNQPMGQAKDAFGNPSPWGEDLDVVYNYITSSN